VACEWYLCMSLVSSRTMLVVRERFFVGCRAIRPLLGIGAWAKPLLPMGDVLVFRWCFAYSG
jgi:hypothetical protein